MFEKYLAKKCNFWLPFTTWFRNFAEIIKIKADSLFVYEVFNLDQLNYAFCYTNRQSINYAFNY